MSLAEIRESERGETAAVYAGLRAGVGVGQVNLIWRIGGVPGVLDWLWAQARPALEAAPRQGRGTRSRRP